MDTHTLIVMNVLLYVLYACVIMLNARMTGITKGARRFAEANLIRGAGLLLMWSSGSLPMRSQITFALSGSLAVIGILMLHLSFVALLDRGPLLRSLQYTLVAMMMAGTVYLLFVPSIYPVALLLSCAIQGVQVAVTASVVFLFSGEEMRLAAWLTGILLASYAFVMLVWVAVTLSFGTLHYQVLETDMTRFWLIGCLITNSAIAFGFMFLSSAKLRLELLWHAQVDELTGLLNRWALRRVALREISRCSRTKGLIAVLMMDLDGLKLINDSLGHGGGDVVLQAVAEVLKETVRDQDVVARIGGDEFCILLPDTGLTEAATVAERLRLQVDRLMCPYRGQTVRVFASLGVASSEECGLSWQRLMEQSDGALYEAKRGGKNRVVTSGSMDSSGVANSIETLREGGLSS